jgi:ankyrin repeat protein
MSRSAGVVVCLLSCTLAAAGQTEPSFEKIPYQVVRAHEIKPHRRSIPIEGVRPGFHQLSLSLSISPTGDITHAEANGSPDDLKFWPQIKGQIEQWRFLPFEEAGLAITAEIEDYVDLVPPERLPTVHFAPPIIKPASKVEITLERSGCMGTCPSYSVTVGTDGIVFDGTGNVVALGKHSDRVDADAVRKLARTFVDADFYSMEPTYHSAVTDMPAYALTISIDGVTHKVSDYVGQREGMPEVIADLEEEVDSFAKADRWIKGADGLVAVLRNEGFNFHTVDGQVIAKAAANGAMIDTLRECLENGVPMEPLVQPKPVRENSYVPFRGIGWLTAASRHYEALAILIAAKASNNDQRDKDVALAGAAASGDVKSVRALIGYGANPNADLRKLVVTEVYGGMVSSGRGSGSILINAAKSGNPEVIKEILSFHPKLEARGEDGKTAMFAAAESGDNDVDDSRVECVRLLAKAGANVNARDKDGNTPLHETFLTDVEEELLRLGADVNAQNADGETPIFTTVDPDAIPLYVKHGANLSIRNKKGESVLEAAKQRGTAIQEELRWAIQKSVQN